MTARFTLLLLVIAFAAQVSAAQDTATAPQKANTRPTPTPTALAAKAEPYDKADIKTMAAQCVRFDTEDGVIEAELYPEQAPETVRNFLNLVGTGSYDTTTFSRVVPGFVIQGGNLTTRDGPWTNELAMRARRTIPDEPNKIPHVAGVLSMARPDTPNGASTHFFILLTNAPDLDGVFAAFGRVTKGMDVVEKINKAPVVGEKPEKPVRITTVTLFPCAATQSAPK
jgi:peptidyl-prolyl cis-trans isomerase B (cyclophilin B)